MRALIVEDDATIADFVAQGLRGAGFVVDAVGDGSSGLQRATDGGYDIAVVDLMLPGMDGLSLINAMRQRRVATPVLILSAKRSVDDRVMGLQVGGDDYLTKPFALPELLARVQALIRRATGTAPVTSLSVGDLTLDLMTRVATRGGRELETLRPREFALLEYLMRNTGRVVSKAMILSHIWDYSFDPRTNVVDVLIHRLRDRVDKGFDQKLIHTVRGIGYVLKVA